MLENIFLGYMFPSWSPEGQGLLLSVVQLTGAIPKPPRRTVWGKSSHRKKMSLGREQVERCEELGHGQGVGTGGSDLCWEWVLGAAEAAGL